MKSSSAIIKELRNSVGMNQREFSEHVGISVRTIQDWEIGRRVPPDYVPRLLRYQLAYEKLCSRRSVLIAFFREHQQKTFQIGSCLIKWLCLVIKKKILRFF